MALLNCLGLSMYLLLHRVKGYNDSSILFDESFDGASKSDENYGVATLYADKGKAQLLDDFTQAKMVMIIAYSK
jgi:hypothetical protein